MKSKQNEEFVYQAVLNGDLEILPDGTIWRLRKRGWDRWNNRAVSRPCKRVRAENDDGSYFQVRIMIDKARLCALAHRLVYRHFNGPIPSDLQINHKNGDKKDNRPENLELTTASENMKHAYRTGLKDEHGEKNPAARLTNAQVEEIRAIYAGSNVTQASLAGRFRVRFQTISRIVRGDRRPKESGATGDYTARRQHPVVRNKKGQFRSA